MIGDSLKENSKSYQFVHSLFGCLYDSPRVKTLSSRQNSNMSIFSWDQVSFIFNIILSFSLLFVWFKQYAKEQAIKNNLIAIRRIIDRIQNSDNLGKPKDLIDYLDATLATLGTRHPFDEKRNEILDMVLRKFKVESEKKLEPLLNE